MSQVKREPKTEAIRVRMSSSLKAQLLDEMHKDHRDDLSDTIRAVLRDGLKARQQQSQQGG